MLADYVVVYLPQGNCFAIPHYEIESLVDFKAEPQVISLNNGVQFEGIPLMHFGTWGLMQLRMAKIDLMDYLRGFVEDPESIRSCYSSRIGEKAVKFFTELKAKYPEMARMTRYLPKTGRGHGLPEYALVKKAS